MEFIGEIGDGVCNPGSDTDRPPLVCGDRPFALATRVIGYIDGSVPAIWGIPPISSGANNCMGFPTDGLATGLEDGWFCAAVEATDNLGNKSISGVIRVCMDSDGNGIECPMPIGGTVTTGLPDCTGTLDVTTDTVNVAGSCSSPPDFQQIIRLRR